MKIYSQNVFTGLSLVVISLFIGNGFLIGSVHAQTNSAGVTVQGKKTSEFKQDIEKGVQEVKSDKDAQKNQQEIDSDDSESAGDEHGDVKEIDGENNQSEIDNEIEQEVDQEDATSGQSSDQENNSTSTSTQNGASSGNTEN